LVLLEGLSFTSQQRRTCVSGQTCAFDAIRGQHLSASDQILLLDTCATSDHMMGWFDANFSREMPTPGTIIDRYTGAGFASEVTSTGASFSWGSVEITSKGGEYRMCCVLVALNAVLQTSLQSTWDR
jgi:hypothetical protein